MSWSTFLGFLLFAKGFLSVVLFFLIIANLHLVPANFCFLFIFFILSFFFLHFFELDVGVSALVAAWPSHKIMASAAAALAATITK
jgi:hypothetical protein